MCRWRGGPREGRPPQEAVLGLAKGEGPLVGSQTFLPFPSCPVSQAGEILGKWPLSRVQRV